MLRDDDYEFNGPSKIKRIVHDENEDDIDDDYMKVRLYFFVADKALRNKLFTEEWFLIAKESLDDPEELKPSAIPFLEVSSCLLKALV